MSKPDLRHELQIIRQRMSEDPIDPALSEKEQEAALKALLNERREKPTRSTEADHDQ